jgi:hypothetical protein
MMILRNGKFSGKILRKIVWKIFHLTSLDEADHFHPVLTSKKSGAVLHSTYFSMTRKGNVTFTSLAYNPKYIIQ